MTVYFFKVQCIQTREGANGSIEEHIKFLNTMHSTTNFTATISNVHIDYLDVTIFKGLKKWYSRHQYVYTKPCETSLFLNPTSYLSGFIKGELLRIVRNSINSKDAMEHSDIFTDKLNILKDQAT